jgi:hypothetical protein
MPYRTPVMRRGANVRARMRRRARSAFPLALACLLGCLLAAGCSGKGKKELIRVSTTETTTVSGPATPLPGAAGLGIPTLATKNTTRVAGTDPVLDAAGVALAVYPSTIPGTHPTAVVLAPSDDWEASLAASVLMASPVRAPLLLSGPGALPAATSEALATLKPTGASSLSGVQLVRVGDTPAMAGLRSTQIAGRDPFTLTAAIDRFASAVAGKPSSQVVIASADQPAYAMPAAGWAAESGDPLLFVTGTSIPAATRQALVAHQHPSIYVLGPSSVIPDSLLAQLGKYGSVKRVGAQGPAANSVAFTTYRDPACVKLQPCVHIPGSFGWALTSPGHGYTLVNAARTLDAAAAAALSASGQFGPELLVEDPSKLPASVLNYFLDTEPGYTQEGPTAAVYSHGWVIGDPTAVSLAVQAEVDSLIQAVPQR